MSIDTFDRRRDIDIHRIADALEAIAKYTGRMASGFSHTPRRGDEVERWLKHRVATGAGLAQLALESALADYQECADLGRPLSGGTTGEAG